MDMVEPTIYIQEKEVKTEKLFKYLGSMFDANGGAEKDVNNRVNIAWSKWRETTGVMCDRNIPTKLKDKVYKTAIKPAMVYGAEYWPVRKEERKWHTTEMCMLRSVRGKTRLDHVRNVDIWKKAHVYPMAEFLREKRLRWYGPVQREDEKITGFHCHAHRCVLVRAGRYDALMIHNNELKHHPHL